MSSLLSSLLSIIHNVLGFFISEKCVENYMTNLNFLDAECGKLFLSKALGYGIILGSVMVKVPQIVKLMNAKSGKGVSLVSQSLELIALSSTIAYSLNMKFAFSTFGESIFLSAQTGFIAFLILVYGGQTMGCFLFVAIYGVAMSYLCSPLAPLSLLQLLQTLNIPLTAGSKLVQIIANYRASSTGQLSAITLLLIFLGSMARIFTSIQETGDNLLIITYSVASLFNLILVFQLYYYWNSSSSVPRKVSSKRSETRKIK
jgi:mannose-P-dolichol utilization defect 1